MSKRVLKQFKKTYNGAVFQFNPPRESTKTIKKICNTSCLPEDTTSEEIIREVRK